MILVALLSLLPSCDSFDGISTAKEERFLDCRTAMDVCLTDADCWSPLQLVARLCDDRCTEKCSHSLERLLLSRAGASLLYCQRNRQHLDHKVANLHTWQSRCARERCEDVYFDCMFEPTGRCSWNLIAFRKFCQPSSLTDEFANPKLCKYYQNVLYRDQQHLTTRFLTCSEKDHYSPQFRTISQNMKILHYHLHREGGRTISCHSVQTECGRNRECRSHLTGHITRLAEAGGSCREAMHSFRQLYRETPLFQTAMEKCDCSQHASRLCGVHVNYGRFARLHQCPDQPVFPEHVGRPENGVRPVAAAGMQLSQLPSSHPFHPPPSLTHISAICTFLLFRL